jgi:hypothetical protein
MQSIAAPMNSVAFSIKRSLIPVEHNREGSSVSASSTMPSMASSPPLVGMAASLLVGMMVSSFDTALKGTKMIILRCPLQVQKNPLDIWIAFGGFEQSIIHFGILDFCLHTRVTCFLHRRRNFNPLLPIIFRNRNLIPFEQSKEHHDMSLLRFNNIDKGANGSKFFQDQSVSSARFVFIFKGFDQGILQLLGHWDLHLVMSVVSMDGPN